MTDLLTDLERVRVLIMDRGLEPHLGALISESGEQDRDRMLRTLEAATPQQLDALNKLHRASLVGQSALLRASLWAIWADFSAAGADLVTRLRSRGKLGR